MLSEYLRQAWEANNAYQPPTHGRHFRTPMWEFVRRAKAHSDLVGLDVFEALAAIESCFRYWDSASEDDDCWKALFPNSDDPKEEFIYTWDSIKWPRNELDRAQAEATALPLKPHRCFSAGYARFISIAGHLQNGVSGPILLPCTTFSQLLHCAPMAISRYRRWAQNDGLLKLTSKGSRVQRKADEFSFAVELFDWKTGEQIPSEVLNRCLPSSPKCYTEIQEKERKREIQETQEKQEKNEGQEMKGKTRALLPDKRKCAVKQSPYIPTVDEVARELQKTAHLRTCM